MHFGGHLLLQRKKLNISADELAKEIGISRSYVTLMENGKRLPSAKIIPEISRALMIKTSTVINWYLEDVKNRLEKGSEVNPAEEKS